MKRLRYRHLTATALLTLFMTSLASAATPALTDLSGHWAAGEINAAVKAGWIQGYPDRTFRPEAPVTRAEFLTMLSRLLDSQGHAPVNDQRLAWYADRVAEDDHWAVQAGYVKGTLAHGVLEPTDYTLTFTQGGGVDSWVLAPDSPLRRLDASILLTRALGGKYAAERPWFHPDELSLPQPTFADHASLPTWSLGWVDLAGQNGIVRGYPDGSFGGERTITRAEAVTMLNRMVATPPVEAALTGEVRVGYSSPPQAEGLAGLAEANRNLSPTLTLTVRDEEQEPAWAIEHAWASLDRAEKESALQKIAVAYHHQVNEASLEPLVLKQVQIRLATHFGTLATLTWDGESAAYAEAEPLQPEESYADLASTLLTRLTVQQDSAPEEIERSKANLAQIESDLAHLTHRKILVFPYQYLSDWFAQEQAAVLEWARTEAAPYFEQVRAQESIHGGQVEHVELVVAPSDTAHRAPSYRSIDLAASLIANPVLVLRYDGQEISVVSRPESLSTYLKAPVVVYQQENCGEGCGQEIIDPSRPEAQEIIRTLTMTLGQTGP